MKPQVSSSGRAAQLSYELPHRIYDAKIYPVKAPNGSTVIIYAHENGVRIIWRGGRPLKHVALPKEQPKPAKVNGTGKDVIMVIDDSDEDETPAETEFEEEVEELDPEAPYPTFIQQIDLALNVEVLHIAVPKIPEVTPIRPADSMPPIFSDKIVFAVACVDYDIRIITLPLSPPSHANKATPATKNKSKWGEQIIDIKNGHQSIPTGISMTWTSTSQKDLVDDWAEDIDMDDNEEEESTPRVRSSRRRSRTRSGSRAGDDIEKWSLLIASHSGERGGILRIWRFPIAPGGIAVRPPVTPYRTEYLTSPAERIAFSSAQYPKRRHSQLLVVDPTGIVRVYDPLAPPQKRSRSSRQEDIETGAWLASFSTTFEVPKNYSPTVPGLAHRKRILDASWASDGRSIVALLADGEWGIWDFDRSGPQPPADPSTFSLRGFIGTSSTHPTTSSSLKSRNTRSSLAPMTPNTRRTKEESLFQGSTSSQPSVSRGGITIEALHSTTGGVPEESVILWYGPDTYRIPNFGQFWSRSATGGGGSLFGPGLVKVQGLNLLGEAVTTIQQFDTTTAAARMAIPRDILVVAEHRLIIQTSTTAPSGALGSIFSDKERNEHELTLKSDQSKLSSRELDVGGMDRLLDSMEFEQPRGTSGSLVLGNPRKVLFAS
ncbi:hypothetical protein BU16DRAFT_254873 [Lophium mytilinum]|uniref:WD40 repeat-like protein n=1 Tax=Lophium mytilinum TaxID=390894 RepID=A0A6A6R7X6_9PEZI|nr:hypothetical protein BU16DRAFT_254873 [Lophium mytilinum]